MGKCLVSVAMTTYNHAKYIRQALNSILMQKTDYDYEIVIGDDCSTDETQEILREYQKEYPEIILPILREKNLGATKNLYDVFLNCKGNYIAVLEGDDFWTDQNKLRLQIGFLKNNNSYIACTHRYSVVDEDNNVLQASYIGPGRPEDGIYTIKDFEKYIYFGHIGTLVFRNIFLQPKYDYTIISNVHNFIGDITLCMILACLGDIFVMKENMSSYRSVQKKGGTNFCSTIAKTNGCLDRFNYLQKLERYCKAEMKFVLKHENRISHYTWWSILYMVRYPSKHNWKCLKEFYSMADNKVQLYGYIGIQVIKLPNIILKHFNKKWKKKRIKKHW